MRVEWIATGLLAVALGGCAASTTIEGNEVRLQGSDTMVELNRRLAEAFMRANPGVAVVVEGGGTSSGVSALIGGRVDLAAASRPFSPEEIADLHGSVGTLGVRFLIARDALSVYLHPTNPVAELSLDELRSLFAGGIANWSELGGRDQEVVVVVRPPNSGTHRFFRDHVLKGDEYADGALTVSRTADVVRAVAGDPAAIGYGGIIFGEGLRHCRIGGVEPSSVTVRAGSYPLARYLYLYAAAPPRGWIKSFVDWCTAPEGQQVVQEVGFIPLWVD
jgi:phosphate transport system substrate-binding protein